MQSGAVASIIAALALGFVEGLGRFYPARQTWWRLRRRRGRLAVRLMRERFESAATHKSPRVLALVLFALVVVWVAISSLLDKRWYEVAMDSLPYLFIVVALLRTPRVLARIGERMRGYEQDAGEDPDADLEDDYGDGDSSAIAL